jgi:hypothetical protein
MAIAKLSPQDRRIVFECLTAAAKGPFFSDDDLSIIFGLNRQELLKIVARIPHIDDIEPQVRRAIGHSFRAVHDDIAYTNPKRERGPSLTLRVSVPDLTANRSNELLRYPHRQGSKWSDWLSVTPAYLAEVEKRWWQLQPPIQYSSLEVYGPVMLNGLFYRVIAYTVHGGGNGMISQVWKGGKWVEPLEGPGCNAIRVAVPATEEVLRVMGVDVSPLPLGYDPLKVEWEEETPPTETQLEDLQSRLADYEANPKAGSSWEEVKARLRERS